MNVINMNWQNMTDAEVYEQGIEILMDRLGPTNLIRFLRQCKPCTGDYTAERQKSISDTTNIKIIVKRIEKKRKEQLTVPKNENPKSVNDMTDIEIYEFGLKAISLKLGPVGIVRFVHLFDTDGFTYAVDQLKIPNTDGRSESETG